jgi:hypothetical protein
VRIVYVLPSNRGQQQPNNAANYFSLHWRPPHVTGIEFGELDSINIRGLSAMIVRSGVPTERIRYIIGATGEGRRKLRKSPGDPLTSVDYLFLDNSERVRVWLLSNAVLYDPLDLLVYCYRDRDDQRQATPAPPGINYLEEDDVHNWARDPAAERAGQMHVRALPQDIRQDPAPGNVPNEQQDEDSSDFSAASSDNSAAADWPEEPNGAPNGQRAESLAKRIPLGEKTSGLENRGLPLDLVHCPAQGDKGRKRGAQSSTENGAHQTPKRIRLSAILKEFVKSEGVQKRGLQFDDENSEEPKAKRLAREYLKWDARV